MLSVYICKKKPYQNIANTLLYCMMSSAHEFLHNLMAIHFNIRALCYFYIVWRPVRTNFYIIFFKGYIITCAYSASMSAVFVYYLKIIIYSMWTAQRLSALSWYALQKNVQISMCIFHFYLYTHIYINTRFDDNPHTFLIFIYGMIIESKFLVIIKTFF